MKHAVSQNLRGTEVTFEEIIGRIERHREDLERDLNSVEDWMPDDAQ